MSVWDYSFARPNLAGQGLEGVARYLDFLPNGKVLTVGERDQIFSLGIPILLNWENAATDMRGGAAVGAQHGAEANRQADLLGWPKDRPIVYSADWDAQPGEFDAVEQYLRAAAAKGRPAGIYGKNALVDTMLRRGAARYGWVTLAWQYGQPVTPLACLYQDGVNAPNGTDHNRVLKPDWGQWHPTRSAVLTSSVTADPHIAASMEESTVAHVFNPTRNRWDEVTVGVDHRLYQRAAATFSDLAAGNNGPIGDMSTLAKRIGGLVWADADTLTLSVHGMDDAVYHLSMTVSGGWGPAVAVQHTVLVADPAGGGSVDEVALAKRVAGRLVDALKSAAS